MPGWGTWSRLGLVATIWTLPTCSALDDDGRMGAEASGQLASCPPSEDALTGDACAFGAALGNCDNGLCGSCGSGSGCEVTSFTCDVSGTLRRAHLARVGCPDALSPSPSQPAPTLWRDCHDALTVGSPFDTCEGDWACARHRLDDCCLDLVLCDPDGELVQLLVCAEGCERLEPRDDLPMATDCIAAREGVLVAGQPCEGAFACVGDNELGALPFVEHLHASPLVWCGAGVVQVATDLFTVVNL